MDWRISVHKSIPFNSVPLLLCVLRSLELSYLTSWIVERKTYIMPNSDIPFYVNNTGSIIQEVSGSKHATLRMMLKLLSTRNLCYIKLMFILLVPFAVPVVFCLFVVINLLSLALEVTPDWANYSSSSLLFAGQITNRIKSHNTRFKDELLLI